MTHMDEARRARRAFLTALSLRPDGHGYEEFSLKGYTTGQVELMVKLLQLDGLVNAVSVSQGLGPGRDSVQPSTLTSKGRSYLKSLTDGGDDEDE